MDIRQNNMSDLSRYQKSANFIDYTSAHPLHKHVSITGSVCSKQDLSD